MGDNKKFYIIIGILVLILVLQWVFKPKAQPSSFDESVKQFNNSLKDFNAMNDQLRQRAAALDSLRDSLDIRYDAERGRLDKQVGDIANRIGSLDRKFLTISTEVYSLRRQWEASGGPDTIPTLNTLSSQN